MYEVLSPLGDPSIGEVPAPRIADLRGKTVCEVWNGSFKGNEMFPIVRELLQKRYPDIKVIPYSEFPLQRVVGSTRQLLERAQTAVALAREKGCDAMITGNAFWGTCTPACTRPAIGAAKAGIPAVVVAASTFVRTASLVASGSGVSDLAVAEYPGAIDLHSEAEIRDNVEKIVLDRIIGGLTQPVGKPRVARGPEEPGRIVFKGSLEDVNQFFSDKGWTDGTAIIPPTPERVEQFLRYTDRRPDEEIAVLPQANLRATPRNIAVNAIMAGCRPEYMPLLVAAVEAIGDPEFQLMSVGTTVCDVPWLLVNGPVVKQLGIQYGVGLASRGPNPAIGRALRLILHNIAGFRPAEMAMATWGYFQPFVLAEDEDACDEVGWEPYQVEHGFGRDASTVTARATFNWGFQVRPVGSEAGPILEVARVHQSRLVPAELSLKFGPRNMVTVLITPPTARVIGNGGYSKRDVAEYLWHHTRVTVREADDLLANFTKVPPEEAISGTFATTVHLHVEEGRLPKWFDVGPDQTIPVLSSPDLIDVVVCGDDNRNKIMTLWCTYNRPVTKGITLPPDWENLPKGPKK